MSFVIVLQWPWNYSKLTVSYGSKRRTLMVIKVTWKTPPLWKVFSIEQELSQWLTWQDFIFDSLFYNLVWKYNKSHQITLKTSYYNTLKWFPSLTPHKLDQAVWSFVYMSSLLKLDAKFVILSYFSLHLWPITRSPAPKIGPYEAKHRIACSGLTKVIFYLRSIDSRNVPPVVSSTNPCILFQERGVKPATTLLN